MQTAASEIEKGDQPGGQVLTRRPNGPATRVVIENTPGFKLGDFLWANPSAPWGWSARRRWSSFLTYFLLLSGYLQTEAGTTRRADAFEQEDHRPILDDINESVQRHAHAPGDQRAGGAAYLDRAALIGLENAGAWAVAAGLLHVIPYFGPAVTAAAIGMAAFMQFDTLSMALLPAGASLAVATFVGTFVTTWMTGRIAKMNTAAVFVSLLFWAWLWGIWGMLLSIPITVIVKVVAQHIEQLEPIAELLGE
ncbi:MAG: AI-2E family transporter [Propionivibrio sp.]|nr:AI-2E family transporter [Propionivibrio sp.]